MMVFINFFPMSQERTKDLDVFSSLREQGAQIQVCYVGSQSPQAI